MIKVILEFTNGRKSVLSDTQLERGGDTIYNIQYGHVRELPQVETSDLYQQQKGRRWQQSKGRSWPSETWDRTEELKESRLQEERA